MKKYLSSILSLILALAMVFSLVACSADDSNDDDDDDDDNSRSSSSQSESSDDDDNSSSLSSESEDDEDDDGVKKPSKEDDEDDDRTSSKVESDKKTESDSKPITSPDDDSTTSRVETPVVDETLTPQINVAGTWMANFDISDMVQEKLSDNPDTAHVMEYVEFGTMNLKMYLQLQSNGKAKMYVDEDNLLDIVNVMKDGYVDGFMLMLKNDCESLYGMSYEEYLSMSGMTEAQLEQALSSVMSAAITPEMLSEAFPNMETEGTYKIDGKKLTLISNEGAVDTAEYKNGKLYMTSEGMSFVFSKQ